MKHLICFLFPVLLLVACVQTDQTGPNASSDLNSERLETIKQIAATYHELDPMNVDSIFTEDFTGNGENGHTWDRESHRDYLANGRFKVDSIIRQVAEDDWVCTHFTRTMNYKGERITVPVMHFKHFDGRKIDEVWEYYDFKEESEE